MLYVQHLAHWLSAVFLGLLSADVIQIITVNLTTGIFPFIQ